MADVSTLAAALLAARRDKEAADDAVKVANRAVEAAEAALFAALVDAELESVTHDGHRFTLDPKAYYSVPAERLDAFAEVMEQLGRGDIFKRTVHYQTLQATLRELADQTGGELPGDVAALVTVFDKGKVSVRKAPAGRKG